MRPEARLMNEKKGAKIFLKVCVKELDSNMIKQLRGCIHTDTQPVTTQPHRVHNHPSSQQVRASVVHLVEMQTYSMLSRLLRKQEVHGCFI